MVKKVNIKANVPIKDFKPPIYGTCNGIEMTTGEILKCLCKHAIIDEVLPDGSTIRLDMKNYYTDNTPKVPAANKVQVVETKVPVEVNNKASVVEHNEAVECETAAVVDSNTNSETEKDADEGDADEGDDVSDTANLTINRTATNNYNHNKKKKKH